MGGNESSNKTVEVTGEMLISIQGLSGTGKTSLIKKMKGQKFEENYIKTKQLEVNQIYWKHIGFKNEYLRCLVWDVVAPEINRDDKDNDFEKIDSLSRMDGIIILYDPLKIQTVRYAINIINEAPSRIPIVLLANFLDKRKSKPLLLPILERYMSRVIHIHVSLKTNEGIDLLKKWLDGPFLYNKRKSYIAMLNDASQNLINMKKNLQSMIEEKEDFMAQQHSFNVRQRDEVPSIDKSYVQKYPSQKPLIEELV